MINNRLKMIRIMQLNKTETAYIAVSVLLFNMTHVNG